ncbi:hypothetical protein [Streptomyces sp. CG 926]|uniref:hypothetical protein n=1 Tax=Streptomyces sp. CG 926 TaxID=1882405 RepID=UPI0011B6DDB5|nr:hypothetical protein [Streptomyces sp. CG 926]
MAVFLVVVTHSVAARTDNVTDCGKDHGGEALANNRLIRARQWWTDTPRTIRFVAYICVPMGVCGTVLGVYGDAHGWWEDRGFLTNLTSSLASAMFGIPTALLVLSHLGNAQAEALQRRQVRRRAQREVEAFRGVLLRVFSAEDVTTLRAHKAGADRAIQEMAEAPLRQPSAGTADAPALTLLEWLDQLRDPADAYNQALAEMMATIGGRHWGVWLDEIQDHWEAIDQDLRPQVADTGQPWLTPTRSVEMRRVWLNLRTGNPSRPLALDTFRQRLTDGAQDPGGIHRVKRGVQNEIRVRHEWLAALSVILATVDELSLIY